MIVFRPISSSAAQSVKSKYWSNSLRGVSIPAFRLMQEIREHPVTSRCWRFVHFVTTLKIDWFVSELQNCVWRCVIFGHRRTIDWMPFSVSLQPSLSITRSTLELFSPDWSTNRLKIQFKALSPLTSSPFKEIVFHNRGFQMSFSKRRQTVAITSRSKVSSHWNILMITSFDRASKYICPLLGVISFMLVGK